MILSYVIYSVHIALAQSYFWHNPRITLGTLYACVERKDKMSKKDEYIIIKSYT